MGRRYRMKPGKGRKKKQMYVERGKGGQFKKWTPINRSIRADTRVHAKHTVEPGYGHQGDIRKTRKSLIQLRQSRKRTNLRKRPKNKVSTYIYARKRPETIVDIHERELRRRKRK